MDEDVKIYVDFEKDADKELAKSFYQIDDVFCSKAEPYFERVGDYISTLQKSKNTHSLFLSGRPGIGKTTAVLYYLVKHGLKPIKDFVYYNTHTSPLTLYMTLYNNKDKIIIFDDMQKLFKDEISRNMFLSCLWSPTGKRIVNWNSIVTMDRYEMPKRFIFEVKVIAMVNKIPANMEGIRSRCFNYELNFKHKEILKILDIVASEKKMPDEIMKFIRKNTNEANEVNLRTLIKLNDLYSNSNNWEKLAMEQLELNPDLQTLIKIMKSVKSVTEQIKLFTNETGLQRRTYFLYKKELKKRGF